MKTYLLNRVLQALGVIFAISLITFFVLRVVSGNPVALMLGEYANADTIARVTHEMGFAKEVADRIIFMADGAIVEENIPKEFFLSPKTQRAKLFLGKILKN